MLVTMPLRTSPLLSVRQQAVLLVLAPVAHGGPFGEDQAVALPVQLDDLELHRLADQPRPPLLRVTFRVLLRLPAGGKLRSRDKATHASDPDDHAAAVVAGDHAFKDVLRLE